MFYNKALLQCGENPAQPVSPQCLFVKRVRSTNRAGWRAKHRWCPAFTTAASGARRAPRVFGRKTGVEEAVSLPQRHRAQSLAIDRVRRHPRFDHGERRKTVVIRCSQAAGLRLDMFPDRSRLAAATHGDGLKCNFDDTSPLELCAKGRRKRAVGHKYIDGVARALPLERFLIQNPARYGPLHCSGRKRPTATPLADRWHFSPWSPIEQVLPQTLRQGPLQPAAQCRG